MMAASLMVASAFAQRPPSGPPAVIVEEASIQNFPLSAEALGNASANEAVRIRPVITATLTAIHFQEGEFVVQLLCVCQAKRQSLKNLI